MKKSLIKSLLFFAGLALCIAGFSQTYIPVDNAAAVKFSIKNLGVSTTGNFKGLKGSIEFNAINPAASSFTVSVDAATINTGINARDNHLKKEEYFDVNKYPSITFASTKIEKSATQGAFIINGNISIKGVSKSISFPFTAVEQNGGFLFSGSFKLNRRDFKVGGNSITLSDNLIVSLEVFAKKINE